MTDSIESHDATLANDSSIDPLSTSTMHYSGELSHWNSSGILERRLQTGQNKVRRASSAMNLQKGDVRKAVMYATDGDNAPKS
ncbi:hypothetical protein BJX99DRAFT_235008 [Aspergillus californicus]